MKVKTHIGIFIVGLVISFLLTPITYQIQSDPIKKTYSWYTGKPNEISIKVDDSGIPIVDYGYPLGEQRNPVTTSLYALSYLTEYKEGNQSAKQLFLNCADFLVGSLVDYGNYSVWEYNFPWEKYNMVPPWRSAMAQGLGVQVLILAYNLTGEKRYLESAKKALNAFYVEVSNGGVIIKEGDGWWYEEYADEEGKMPRVLNGMIYALLGIWEYYKITGDENAKYLFDRGITSLKNHLHEYDANCWTFYDALGNLASKKYHNLHVKLMLELYNITGDPAFKKYYEKWGNYNKDYFIHLLKFLKFPSKLEISVFIVNLFLTIAIFETAFLIKRDKKERG